MSFYQNTYHVVIGLETQTHTLFVLVTKTPNNLQKTQMLRLIKCITLNLKTNSNTVPKLYPHPPKKI